MESVQDTSLHGVSISNSPLISPRSARWEDWRGISVHLDPASGGSCDSTAPSRTGMFPTTSALGRHGSWGPSRASFTGTVLVAGWALRGCCWMLMGKAHQDAAGCG